jgi:hypothetical protein
MRPSVVKLAGTTMQDPSKFEKQAKCETTTKKDDVEVEVEVVDVKQSEDAEIMIEERGPTAHRIHHHG